MRVKTANLLYDALQLLSHRIHRETGDKVVINFTTIKGDNLKQGLVMAGDIDYDDVTASASAYLDMIDEVILNQ